MTSRPLRLPEDGYVLDIIQLPSRGVLTEKPDATIFIQQLTNISMKVDTKQEFAVDEKVNTTSDLAKAGVGPLSSSRR